MFLFCHFIRKAYLKSFVRFFLWHKRRKKKARQKRNAEAMFRRVRAATNATRVGWAVAFLKKATQKLLIGFATKW